ncbi:hypothetical protein BD410DRAFT_753434 [Rickenella mellea]|uniref:4'-phosphopantetheinyl transferase domain-containing protein n=1 Tax=Rickenella mellea TaxID=50990 RepID=A0A4Y7PT96_9AGAM|nr:hypothetical protein BD410DRAFT_753434 [Rickenella mellea]
MDSRIYCWALTINRVPTDEEFWSCARVIEEVFPESHLAAMIRSGAPRSGGLVREVFCQLMPILMMKQQGIPRSKWRQYQTENGKRWIDRDLERMHPARHLVSRMGYTTSADLNMVVLAAAQGKTNHVVNIGLSVRRIAVQPDRTRVKAWSQTIAHKLTQFECRQLSGLEDWPRLSRIWILLTIKEALVDGLGQPQDFDFARIECDVPNEVVRIDGQVLLGWEFRLFCSTQECVNMKGKTYHDHYQNTVAFYRGSNLTRIVFEQDPGDAARFTTFCRLTDLLKVLHKLVE